MAEKNSLVRLSQHGLEILPDTWSLSKVKYIGDYINGYPFKPTDWALSGRPILRIQNLTSPETEANKYDGELPEKYLIRRGDYLISWSASLGVFIWQGEDAWLNQHIFKVIINTELITPSFFYWASNWFIGELGRDVHGSTMQHLTADAFGSFPVPIPPFDSQIEIANYLDRETAHIDSLIQAKENLLAMLDEKRQALITQVVTRGLNPDVRLKPSGVDWLGDVPEHWEVERTRWLFKERNERSETGEEEMLTVSHITGVTSRSEKEVNMFEAESTEGYKVCYAGDLVINTLWAWMGAMGIAPLHGIVSPAYHVYTPWSRIKSRYVDVIVRLPIFASEVTRYSKGVWSSRLRLYPEGFYEVYFPVPPLEEQQQIVEHIRVEVDKLNKFQQAAEQTIILLKERRSALIMAAVTGQIDINTTK